MFTLPAAELGEWFVCLVRAPTAARAAAAATARRASRAPRPRARRAGRREQRHHRGGARRRRPCGAPSPAPTTRAAVTDLVLLGTPLAPSRSPRWACRSPPPMRCACSTACCRRPASRSTTTISRSAALVGALMELAPLADPAADLRLPVLPFEGAARQAGGERAVRRGADRAHRAGAHRHRRRRGLPRERARRSRRPDRHSPTGVRAGLRWALPEDTSGTLRISASAQLLAVRLRSRGRRGARAGALRVELRIADALGWLAATPSSSCARFSAVLTLPWMASSPGEARVVLQ